MALASSALRTSLLILLLPCLAFTAGCGSDDDEGSLRYATDADREALEDAANVAVTALKALYGTSVNKAFGQIILHQTTSGGVDPSGVAPSTPDGYDLPIETYPCAGNGPVAHAIAHIARLVVHDDADAGHTDTDLFAEACGSDSACAEATIEESTRSLCAQVGEDPRGGDDTGGTDPTPGR